MNPIEATVRAVDRFQQRHLAAAFLFAVQKKAGDDNAGTLVANMAYAGFVTVFPLLLILVTVLGIVVGSSADLTHRLLNSAVSQFPVIGTKLEQNIHALQRSSTLSLAIGLLLTAWGATGLSQTAMFAMAEIWNVPGVIRPNFVSRLWRAFAFLAVIAVSAIVGGSLSSFGVLGSQGLGYKAAAEIVSGIINVGAYWLAYRVLTPPVVRTRQLLPGAICGGVLWTLIQALGGFLVDRELRHMSAIYGTFALVLGLLAWIYLAARVAVYAAEMNATLAYHLWPRSLVQPPLTEADRRSLTLQVTENSRRPEQRVVVTYDDASLVPPPEIRVAPSPSAPYALFHRHAGGTAERGATDTGDGSGTASGQAPASAPTPASGEAVAGHGGPVRPSSHER